jgi:hypothetical protein
MREPKWLLPSERSSVSIPETDDDSETDEDFNIPIDPHLQNAEASGLDPAQQLHNELSGKIL